MDGKRRRATSGDWAEPFWGVAWGWPSRRGRQLVHIVNGTAPTCVTAICGREVMVPAIALAGRNRPMVTCTSCKRVAQACLILATRGR